MGKSQKRIKTLHLQESILAIDSDYDIPTKKARDYRKKHVYPIFQKMGFVLLERSGKLARRVYVQEDAIKEEVVYITGVGHGEYDTYTGEWGNPIFQVGNYSRAEVEGKIIHFLSCQSAGKLGRDFVKNKCKAFFGYIEKFTFLPDDTTVFFECDSSIDIGFANGFNAEQVYLRTVELFNKHIEAFRQAGELYKAAVLEFDRDHLCCPSVDEIWGDVGARL